MSPASNSTHTPPTSPSKRKERDQHSGKAASKSKKTDKVPKHKNKGPRPSGVTAESLKDAKKTELLNKLITEISELRSEFSDLKDTLQEVLVLVRKMDGKVRKAIGEDKWEEVEVRAPSYAVASSPPESAPFGHQTCDHPQPPRGLGGQQEDRP